MVRLLNSANLGANLGATLALASGVCATRVARAEPCPPAVVLAGDEAVVAPVRAQLGAHGIADETARCPGLHARVERRGPLLVVGIEGPDGAPIEREVREAATAATVIESWARSDVAAPLLAARELPEADEAAAIGAPVVAASSRAEQPGPPGASGIQLFGAEETSVASDRTVWQGLSLGACVMLGPVCAAARVHGGKVISKPSSWEGLRRKGAEVYAGIDIPIALGRTRLTPGFAAGYGMILTHRGSDGDRMGVEISGPRAEAHAAFSLPLSAHIAIDLVLTATLTQATEIESHGQQTFDPTIEFPSEPRAFVRFAVGVRYGAL
ncbi:MAG TPA: hypothetical protein VFT22_35670 [Kofleriaceae bacterium]|nr:hypothetical protein [Kofleriaceae bacterium]